MDFVAIDVETANENLASICQIGVARFSSGRVVDEWKTFIDPEDYFASINVSIHGIDEQAVHGQPNLPKVQRDLESFLKGHALVSHTRFDRVALSRALAKYGLEPQPARWLDSSRIARRAWSQFARKGYGLANLAEFIGYKFSHHDALEDAKAAGFIVLAASKQTGLDLDGWFDRIEKPIDPVLHIPVARDGNPDSDIFGEVLVFTGALSIPRREAADMAAQLGCRVEPNVTKRTTMLVIGDQDLCKLAGHRRSRKQRKAEELIQAGHYIQFLSETDFVVLADISR